MDNINMNQEEKITARDFELDEAEIHSNVDHGTHPQGETAMASYHTSVTNEKQVHVSNNDEGGVPASAISMENRDISNTDEATEPAPDIMIRSSSTQKMKRSTMCF